MKEIELNKETKTARWYKYFWCKSDDQMPADTCTYYRKTIISFFLIPITWFGFIMQKLNTDYCFKTSQRLAITITFYVVPYILGFVWYTKDESYVWYKVWLLGWFTLFLVCVLLTIIILIGALVEHIKDKHRERKYKKHLKSFDQKNAIIEEPVQTPKEPNVIVAWYRQLKDKTCSKIKWT